MSRAHQNSKLVLAGRPVTIDSPYTAYFSYNHSLVSQGYPLYPLVDPTSRLLSGASNAVIGGDQLYNDDYLTVAGKFGNGLIRDETTQNLFTNHTTAVFGSAYNGTNYGFGASTDLQQVLSPNDQLDSRSAVTKVSRITGGTSQKDYVSPGIASPLNTTRIISFWYYGTYGTTISPYNNDGCANLYYLDDSGVWTGGTTSIAVPVPTNTWKRIILKMVNKGSAGGTGWSWLILHSDNQTVTLTNQEFWMFTMWQTEEKAYYTSFTTGTRSEVYLTYPNFPVRTCSLWLKSTSNKTVDGVATPRTILRQIDNLDTYPMWYLYVANTNSTDMLPGTATPVPAGSVILKVKWKTDGVNVTSYLCTVSTINIIDGEWHHIVCEFGLGSICRIRVDDTYGDTVTIPETNYLFNGLLRVGYDSTSELSGNFLIDELRLDNKNYSYDDIRKRYISGVEHYNPYGHGCVCG